MSNPFHLSFVVPNLKTTKAFYVGVLGCSTGRITETWLDILFFGHQITMHQAQEHKPAVPIDHFGPILNKTQWQEISRNCKAENVSFILEPIIKDEGTQTEAGKFIINDPAGNVLEFKFYANKSNVSGDV